MYIVDAANSMTALFGYMDCITSAAAMM